MNKMRFGIIGVGNIAPVHAEAIQGTPGAELVAAATRSETRGRVFAGKFHAAWLGDYGDLLRREDVDVVSLCTPHDLHATMTIDAAAAGKHVLCEKPMARSVAECSAMIEACQRAGVPLGVVFQSRFDPLSQKLKAALDAGKLGRLLWTSANTLF